MFSSSSSSYSLRIAARVSTRPVCRTFPKPSVITTMLPPSPWPRRAFRALTHHHLVKTAHVDMHHRRPHSTSNPDNYDHNHNHNHNPLPHSHSHPKHPHTHTHGAEELVAAFQGATDRGSRITLVGLYSNVLLTGTKGLAGLHMHSASLLADAAHSLSDLLGDFVTLFSWRLSRSPATGSYPYGFAKSETLGTTAVSLLLIIGATGIGFHSCHLLSAALSESLSTLPSGMAQQVLHEIISIAHHIPVFGHSHTHVHVLNPNAAWFAAISVILKEWLYHATKKVADEERSPVLLANAIHHRSDAYSSIVAFAAIIGTWAFPRMPLDPIGGLLVSFVILRQGLSLFSEALKDLMDASVPPTTRDSIEKSLLPLFATSSSPESIPELLAIEDLRARRAGSQIFVDLAARVPATITVEQSYGIECKIAQTLKHARKEITSIQVKFNPYRP